MVIPYEEEICFSFLMIMCIFLTFTRADRTVTVTNSSCGGNIDLNTIDMLRLNYYGAEIGDPSKSDTFYSEDKRCIYAISSTRGFDWDICIQLKLKDHQSSWDLTCTKTLMVYLGQYYSAHLPSKYSCADLLPLCTSQRYINVVFTSENIAILRMAGIREPISVELDVYLKNKMLTTTRRWRYTSVTPVMVEESNNGFSISSIWITIVCIVVVGSCIVCVCACWYRRDSDESLDANNQPTNNQPVGGAPINFSMLNRSIYQLPEENHPATSSVDSTSADPPDYYTVCPTGPPPKKQSLADIAEPYPPAQGLDDHDVIPSAPPPPYPGITG